MREGTLECSQVLPKMGARRSIVFPTNFTARRASLTIDLLLNSSKLWLWLLLVGSGQHRVDRRIRARRKKAPHLVWSRLERNENLWVIKTGHRRQWWTMSFHNCYEMWSPMAMKQVIEAVVNQTIATDMSSQHSASRPLLFYLRLYIYLLLFVSHFWKIKHIK